MHLCAAKGRADVVPLLCLKEAAVDALSGQGGTPLYVAAAADNVAATRALLAAGASTSRRWDEFSALDVAAMRGHVDIVRALFEHGVDAAAAGVNGYRALHFAAANGRAQMVTLM